MRLNDIFMFKLLSFIFCDNTLLRTIVILLFVIDVFFRRNKIKKSNKKDNLLIGNSIIILNELLNINLLRTNFVVFGLLSSLLSCLKKEKLINVYLFLVVIEGGIVFCQNL